MGALDGKVVLVTGGGNGIGRDCALIAAQEGAKVVVNDLGGSLKGEDEGSAGPAEKVCEEIRAAGGEAVAHPLDVTDESSVDAFAKSVTDDLGDVEVLVSNAGRVAAVSSVFIGASNELGEFESGVVARLLGPVGAAVFGGVGALMVTALWARLFPALRKADRLE